MNETARAERHALPIPRTLVAEVSKDASTTGRERCVASGFTPAARFLD